MVSFYSYSLGISAQAKHMRSLPNKNISYERHMKRTMFFLVHVLSLTCIILHWLLSFSLYEKPTKQLEFALLLKPEHILAQSKKRKKLSLRCQSCS